MAAARGSNRARYLSTTLAAYLDFVVAVGLALPVLSYLQDAGLVRIGWLSDYGSRLMYWSVLVAIAFIVFRKSIRTACADLAEWLTEPGADQYRWFIVACCLVIFTCYSWQLHIGIVHRGAPGWVYKAVPDVVHPDAPASLSMPADIDPSVFKSALQPATLRYVHRSGYASNEVLFLHFKDGTMRPANYELVMVTWPKSTFGLVNGRMLHESEFLAMVRLYFSSIRDGRSMLLPFAIAYPRNVNYQPIDYSKYPPAGDITGASIWTLTVYVDHQANTLDVVGASRLAQVQG